MQAWYNSRHSMSCNQANNKWEDARVNCCHVFFSSYFSAVGLVCLCYNYFLYYLLCVEWLETCSIAKSHDMCYVTLPSTHAML